jgi:hypothetical protein
MSASTVNASLAPAATELVLPRPRLRALLAAIARWQQRERLHGDTMPRLRWY